MEQQLPFPGERFAAKWLEWLEYRRKEKRLRAYTEKGLQRTFTRLVRISLGDEWRAIAIIDESMDNQYQGLFPLKEFYGHRSTEPAPGTSKARIDAARNW